MIKYMMIHKLTFIVFLFFSYHSMSAKPMEDTGTSLEEGTTIGYNFDYLVAKNPILSGLVKDSPFKIVLIGVVLDKDKQPVKGAEVALRAVQTGEKINFTTQRDGSFYFRLEADALYQVEVLNEVNNTTYNPIKEIVTAGIRGSKILHTLMELP